MESVWHSPLTGRALTADTPHSLRGEGGERWPVVEGIPYLRSGRKDLVALSLDRLDAGDGDGALVALLSDQDDWWRGPATDEGELRELVARRGELTLREAMALLRFGPVADYFAYRWVDPTFLAGLALLEAHWQAPATAFELAGGIGHYARELGGRGVACVSADIVFAKCWLARNWVAPDAQYVVFDAKDHWPAGERRFDLVQCHDAFYFLPDQERVAARLRDAVAPGGVLAVSHVHNAGYRNGTKGPARPGHEWATIFPDARVFDEEDLLRSLMEACAPIPTDWTDDPEIEAFSLVEGADTPARPVEGGLALPPTDAKLRPNPLLGDGAGHDAVSWPSQRYREEYGRGCFWAIADDSLGVSVARDPVRLRRLVDLPERW